MRDKIHGYLLGAALGDALGKPTEFLSIKDIHATYGPEGIRELEENAVWTDDTQMIIYGGKAMVEVFSSGKQKQIDAVAETIAKHYIEWLDDPGHAPGNTCLQGVYNLKKGIHWRASGVATSKGCGSVMRSGIFGIFYRDEVLKQIASISGKMTHGHPTADAACVAGALSIAHVLEGKSPTEISELLMQETRNMSEEFTQILGKARDLADSSVDDYHGLTTLGQGWVGDEAFAMSFFLFLRHPDDFEKAVVVGANHSGDTDSVASIAGGMIGARIGAQKLPKKWIERLTNVEVLLELGDRIFEVYPF